MNCAHKGQATPRDAVW